MAEPHGGIKKYLNFRQQVLQGQAAIITKLPELEGCIRDVTMHFPAGCNALVWVDLYIANVRVFPKTSLIPADNFIALDDATEKWTLTEGTFNKNMLEYIKRVDTLAVQIQNFDIQNPHTITVIVGIELSETEK